MIKAILGAALVVGLVAPAAAAVNCNTFPNNTVNQFVNDEVIAIGYTCTIGPQASINGNVTQTGAGSLIIRGQVNGGVAEDGLGDVIVAFGARVATARSISLWTCPAWSRATCTKTAMAA
jgi:hypothetical protein